MLDKRQKRMGVPADERKTIPEQASHPLTCPHSRQSGVGASAKLCRQPEQRTPHFFATARERKHTENTQGHLGSAGGHGASGAPSLALPDDVIVKNPPALPSPVTFSIQECSRFDSGASVEMWFMCRLFSPRRRLREQSPSNVPPDQHPHRPEDEGEEENEDEEGDVATPDSSKEEAYEPGPEEQDVTTPTSDSVGTDRRSGGAMATSGVGVVRQAGATVKMKNKEEEEEEASLSPDLSHALGTGSKRVGGHGDWNGGDGDGNGGQNRSTVNILSNRPYITDQAVADTRCTEDSDSNEGLKEQLAMVEAMVQDMKVSFMAALEQLSSLQEGDTSANTTTNNNNNTAATGAWQKMDSRCQRQDEQMSDLAKTIESLRKDVSMLSDSLQQMMNSQHSLQDQVLALQSGQQVLVQELVSAGILTNEKSREVLNKCRLQIQEGRLTGDTGQPRGAKVSDNTQGSQDQEKTDVTAAACKSLSLTQALAARCQDIDVSDSSEEDITSSRASRQQAMDHHGPVLSLQAESPERRQAMQDIVDSEQEYCHQLWMVMQDYQQHLQDGHYMSSRQLCVLFPSPLADLYQHHSHMLQALQDRMAHASYASAVGDVFARMTDTNSNLLGLYQEYVESLPGAISCLRRQMSQSRSFRTFVKEQRESTSNSDLLTLLISPLQRIPKYMLQLQQVLRHTGEDHPDHFHLQASLGKLQDFVERFNHDITHTTQAIALDLQHLQTQGQSFRSSASNSSCEMLPPTTSTIDSGIQSTGEDALPPSFLRSGRAHHDGYQWVEQGYSHTDPKQAMRVPSGMQAQRQIRGQRGEWRLTSHSQPDLSHTGGYVQPNTLDPHSAVPHLRPFVNMATTQGDRSARQRRFKIKKRVEGQGQYRNGSPLRPASAMDFADGPEQEDRERGMMRPHSVLGPFTGDRRARVIQVHGRKPQRATQLTHQVTRSSPRVLVNGHWDPAAGGDPMGHQGHRIEQGGHFAPVVNYEDEEDDTRALSDAPSTGSHKASSRHSHDPHESETDNSDDFSQEDLAAALSLHLNNGAGGHPPHTVSAHELRVGHQHHQMHSSPRPSPHDSHELRVGHQHHQMHSSPRPSPHDSLHYQQQEEEEDDEQVDVHLDSTESDITPSLHQTQKPPHDMSEELKLDLTCFQDDSETKPTLLKRSQTSDPPENARGPLSMKPAGSATNQNTKTVPQAADRSQTEPSKEVVNSLSGDKTFTSLPPIHPQDTLPTVADTNGRLIHAELERPPVRRSVTPNEFSNVARPAVLRRATTPSEFLGTPDVVSSKGGRRRKESKTTSNETLHRSVDDVSLSASKKKPFRTSLKNLFQRKKGCIILDQLEREYTKDLVRLCLVDSNAIPSTTAATTTTTTLNNNIYNHSPQEEGKGQEGGSDKRNGPNHINHDLHHLNSPFSLWSKMKKSPLFSLPRRSDGAVTADSCVL